MEKIELTKSQKILFIILGIVLVYAIFDFVTHKDTYVGFYTGKKQEANALSQNQQVKTQQQKDQLQTSLFSKWGGDPFLRQTRVKKRFRRKAKRPKFDLKAISYRLDGSVALINDRIVKVGDVINGYRVIFIDSRKVILSSGKHRIVLKLTNM